VARAGLVTNGAEDDVDCAIDRRGILAAGGLIGLGAVLAACSGRPSAPRTPPAAPSSPAPPASSTTNAPPPSPVDLLTRAGTCTLTPGTIAGPTWFDAHAVRSDIRDGRPGTPLDLAFRVVHAGPCTPVPNAVVDLWQCDAGGVYSGFAGASPGQGGTRDGVDEYGDDESAATTAEHFLRGTQVSDADGVVQFATVYPGWYPTRTAHLHVKVHLDGSTVLTGQLFFDDAVTDGVYAGQPYTEHPSRDTRNDGDPFFSPAALLELAPDGVRWLGALVLGVP
jgi:protocatechuate 3,4-dioxygenase beta subunit